MVYRERLRSWKESSISVLGVAAQSSGSKKLLEMLGEACDELLSMVLHAPESYDLASQPSRVYSEADKPKLTDAELLSLLDKKLENG